MKPGKLRSPIKAIHEALTSFGLAVVGTPLCLQPPAEIDSSRDHVSGFGSGYYTPALVSASDIASCGSFSHRVQRLPSGFKVITRGEAEGEAAVSVSAAASTRSTCSSRLSFSIAAAASCNPQEEEEKGECLPMEAINSSRFFFTPCTSKFITGERGSPFEIDPKETEAAHQEQEEEEDYYLAVLDGEPETDHMEITREEAAAAKTSALCEKSIPVAMASEDPYWDFRSSMDEMVAVHDLRDWPGLQELLHCYLHLNEKSTHKLILVAFADLIVHLVSQGKIHKSVIHDTFSSASPAAPLPSPHGTHRRLHLYGCARQIN